MFKISLLLRKSNIPFTQDIRNYIDILIFIITIYYSRRNLNCIWNIMPPDGYRIIMEYYLFCNDDLKGFQGRSYQFYIYF